MKSNYILPKESKFRYKIRKSIGLFIHNIGDKFYDPLFENLKQLQRFQQLRRLRLLLEAALLLP